MDCKSFLKLANDSFQQELNQEVRNQLAEHAADCYGCARAMQNLNELSRLMRELSDHTTTRGAAQTEAVLVEEFRKRQMTASHRWWWRAAAIVLVAIAAGALHQASRQVNTSTQPSEAVRLQEIASDFIPLYDNQALVPSRIVRVEMSSDALIQLGFAGFEPASDPVLADVVLSEEGLPQAIRFVSKTSF